MRCQTERLARAISHAENYESGMLIYNRAHPDANYRISHAYYYVHFFNHGAHEEAWGGELIVRV
jgi:hypothetical protein